MASHSCQTQTWGIKAKTTTAEKRKKKKEKNLMTQQFRATTGLPETEEDPRQAAAGSCDVALW